MNSTNRVKRGRFITLEGVDGSGKSTQCRILKEYLISRDIPVMSTREPGGTEIAEEMRSILVHRDLLPMSELLQVMAARYDHIVKKILPAIEAGYTVICDRFIDSTVVYQGLEIDSGMELVYSLHKKLMPSIMPDITFFIDIEPVLAMERVKVRNGSNYSSSNLRNNRFDIKDLDYYKKIHNGFRTLADKYLKRIKTIKVTALSTPTPTHKIITRYYQGLDLGYAKQI
ncbi:dTMP kinase [Rickettsia felis]|uniref:Thymidylate kinase n=1 Tax=Rickettsia felis (strain ATCC VR-1525 / URRWXCal2) TaxID=315456 RepID=Q4UJC5_RICFE|nr:dTMP kinase [Rickettsia felis]AAY62264.1 Thymidylate kinase [Rickettsia felis URRWXCal2]AAY62332.1 Thymidylate kinase [Rickettsia felis URRWXCal2]KHO02390.1 thymidylate kinase [Rickettsia felis]MDE8611972.1 dTMP kinase [Rickettsia felis]